MKFIDYIEMKIKENNTKVEWKKKTGSTRKREYFTNQKVER